MIGMAIPARVMKLLQMHEIRLVAEELTMWEPGELVALLQDLITFAHSYGDHLMLIDDLRDREALLNKCVKFLTDVELLTEKELARKGMGTA